MLSHTERLGILLDGASLEIGTFFDQSLGMATLPPWCYLRSERDIKDIYLVTENCLGSAVLMWTVFDLVITCEQ